MDRKAIVLGDLGYGDCGKGTTTHYKVAKHGVHTVVRTGGPQALHHVVSAEKGCEYTHSQFSSGTLAGAQTFLSRNMVLEPYGLLDEGCNLHKECGVSNPFSLITVDRDALVITRFHRMANRLRELARGDQRHGSVGVGVGETVCDSQAFPETAIYVRDFGTTSLTEKLAEVRSRKLTELEEIIARVGDSCDFARQAVSYLQSERSLEEMREVCELVRENVRIVDRAYLGEVLNRAGTVVFEPSQGALLNEWYGFHPHTTHVNPLISAAHQLLDEQRYDGELQTLGIIRAYHHRHGAGPFVTEHAKLTALLPDRSNGDHPWQGKFRVGPLDFVALRYAIEASGGKQAFDGLSVTCLDRVAGQEWWRYCRRYVYVGTAHESELKRYFEFTGGLVSRIKVRPSTGDEEQLQYQERLGQLLRDCRPHYQKLPSPPINSRRVEDFQPILEAIELHTGIPVRLASFGPTERDKQEVLH